MHVNSRIRFVIVRHKMFNLFIFSTFNTGQLKYHLDVTRFRSRLINNRYLYRSFGFDVHIVYCAIKVFIGIYFLTLMYIVIDMADIT